jgi:hypothetical protein
VPKDDRDLQVVSLTNVAGVINDQRYAGRIEAEFDTGRGGSSRCEFTSLPDTFNPGTLGTHT